MKKNLKIIVAFLLGVALASCVAVYAANYYANSIIYKNNIKVDTALDDLYSKVPSGKTTITSNGTNIDISQYALADVNVSLEGKGSTWNKGELTNISGINTINVGFVPRFFCITRNSNGRTLYYISDMSTTQYNTSWDNEWYDIIANRTSFGVESIGSSVKIYMSTPDVEWTWFAIK